MPIIDKIELPNKGCVLTWDITENLSELKSMLEDDFIYQNIAQINNTSLIKQRLAIQLLLKHYFGKNLTIKKVNNKPFINEQPISISHAYNKSSVYINQDLCGIDIEKITDKPSRIKNRFLNEMELSLFEKYLNDEFYTISWCVKEALFKFLPMGNVVFKEDLIIRQIDWENRIIETTAKNKTQQLSFKKLDEYMLVYTL
ncbi:MAG: hypothetical protein Kow0079_03520 [Vicingaceae bacterium]